MVSNEMMQRIDRFVEENRSNIVADIKKLVDIKSISTASEGENAPFGAGCRQVLDTALELCSSMGFATKNYDYYCGSASIGSGEKEIALLGHLDVVPEGKGWSHDPYDMIEKDGYIYGRGVSDDKGPTVLGLYALKFLKEQNIPLNYTYRLVLGCSEETGMADMQHFMQVEKIPTFAFTPDADFPGIIGEKGGLSFAIHFPVDGKVLTALQGGTVPNAVCGEVTAELSGVTEADLGSYDPAVYTVEAMDGGIRVTAKGKTSHAAKPEGSVNAIALLFGLLEKLPQASEMEKKTARGVLDVLSDYNGAGIGIPVEDEPSGKLTHISGLAHLEGNEVVLSFDIRYPVTCNGLELMERVKEHVAKMGFTAVLDHDSKPSYRPADTQEVQCLMSAYEQVTGEKGVPVVIGGGTYARHFPNAIAFGPHFEEMANPAGEGKGGEHMPDECTSVDYMMKAVRIYILALLGLNELSL